VKISKEPKHVIDTDTKSKDSQTKNKFATGVKNGIVGGLGAAAGVLLGLFLALALLSAVG
jgi:hypothetical protein